MTGRGGLRPGSGRPPKRVLHESPIRVAEKKIADRLPWLVDKLMELVEGVEVRDVDRYGKRRVYSLPPDRQAAEYLIDRILGKPTQPVDVIRSVRELAAQYGLTDEETTEAVAEAEKILKETSSAGHR